ncbi:MAG: FtsX-like permease family protein [Firmicutes bacterium]|uniref:FtsX-like permease family protein n=1 Tax=Candidatus Gallilactobacillus intestinavium TaxID=2840838 RepID=A0A9D9E684_9LACO|nr:FtsX-like permease family protein [Candidatus Gallilactobacillus intestinavium]
MFKLLFLKNIRDFRKNFGEFLSIFILAFISLFVFSGLLSVSNGINNSYEQWANKSNLATQFVKVRNHDHLNSLKVNKKIVNIDGQFQTNCTLNSNKNKLLQLNIIQKNDVSKFFVKKGASFNKNAYGVWLDYNFAKKNKLSVGDKVQLNIGNKNISCPIVGLIESPNYIGYTSPSNNIVANHSRYGYVFSNYKTMPIFKNEINSLLIRSTMNASKNDIDSYIRNKLGTNVIYLNTRKSNTNIVKIIDKVATIKKLALMFCSILFFLVIVTTTTTVERLVNSQKTIIGSLKALGLSNFKIKLHYVIYGAFPTFIGSILGLYLGPITIGKDILNKQKALYNMPNWHILFSRYSWLALIIIVLVGILSSFYAVNKLLSSDSIASIMQNQSVEHNLIFQPHFKFSWSTNWVLRDKLRSLGKELIGVVGISGSIMLLMASIGEFNSFKYTNNQTFGTVFSYKNEIKTIPLSKNDNEKILNELDNDYQELQQANSEIQNSNKSISTTMNIIDNGIYINLPLSKNKNININKKGVYITHYLAKKYGLKVGSNIKIMSQYQSKPIYLPILGITKISGPQGIYLSKNIWTSLGNKFTPNVIFTNRNISKKIINMPSVVETTSLSQNLYQANKVIDTFSSIMMLLIIFAILLSWFILFNLNMLNFIERKHEYSTMKVMGFYQKEIQNIILKDSIITYIFGVIIGVPLGLIFLKYYITVANSDTTEFFAHIGIMGIIVSCVIVLINVILISMVIGKRVKKINMASAFKSVN